MAKRNYENKFPSVTQVLDCLRKPGLEGWFKVNTPEYIKTYSEKAKEIGTQTHEIIQNHIEAKEAKIETQYPDEITNTLKSFMLFKSEHPELILQRSEIALTSKKYKYNGTIDVIAKWQKLILGDWKTGNAKEEEKPKIWDEMKYQLSAYFNLLNEVEKLDIDEGFIVVLAKDKVAYNFQMIGKEELTKCFKNVFLPALKICNFKRKK